MATKPQQESDVVLGIVKKAWPYNEERPASPAKLVIDTDQGTVADIAFFNQWDGVFGSPESRPASPPRLGEQWAKIDPDRDEGRRIQVICFQALVKGTDEQKFYEGRPQFVMGKGASIKFLDAAPATPTAPAPAAAPAAPTETPVPAARATPIDGAKWGMYFNNSALVNVNVPLEQQAAMWRRILRDAAWLYQLTAEDIAAFLEDDEDGEAEAEEQDGGASTPVEDDDDSGDDALLATV